MEDAHTGHPQKDVSGEEREQSSESARAMVRLGNYNQLTVVKEMDFGLCLDRGEEGEILPPKRYVLSEYEIGEPLRAFVYLDQGERLVATTQTPLVRVSEFVYLGCSWVDKYGVLLN